MTLRERINAALVRVAHGHAPMRIPADPTDVDLVLADCEKELDALAAQLAAAREALEELREEFAHHPMEFDDGTVSACDWISERLSSPAAAAEALLERVRSKERERCAKVAKARDGCSPGCDRPDDIAEAILAPGKP
jgi:hypothetical protein